MSEALIIALFSAAGILLGYVIRAVELAARNTTTVQRNAILGFSDLCQHLTARLALVEAELGKADQRITQLEAEITSLMHANHQLRLKLDTIPKS